MANERVFEYLTAPEIRFLDAALSLLLAQGFGLCALSQ